jgi:succinate dehydrogenase/fumarate reductase flavoprotein subunit
LTKGPYVACPRVACVHHTMGGIQIDTLCRVLVRTVRPSRPVCRGRSHGGVHGGNRLAGTRSWIPSCSQASGESAAAGKKARIKRHGLGAALKWAAPSVR